jgi:HK97 gp10 family phage protein
MADGLVVKLAGVDDLKRALAEAAVTIRTKAVRGALRDAGKVIQAAARAAAPVLNVPSKTRAPGTVKKNIVVRASKFARAAGDEGVYINVRGIRGRARVKKLGKAGARNPNDPYYWRFLELGTRKMAARPFLRPAATSKGQEAIAKFMQSVVPQIEKLNARVKSK